MAILKRHRHGKRYTSKEIARGDLMCGASAPHGAHEWWHMTIRLREADENKDSYGIEMDRKECQRLVRTLSEFLERGPGAPILVNGSKGHA